MNVHRHGRRAFLALFLAALLTSAAPQAQRGGGGGGGGGASAAKPGRLALLETAFTLTEDQRKSVKTLMDAEFKAAAPLRDQLTKARTAAGMAIQTGKDQAAIDQAAAAYAAQASALAAAEMKALAKIVAVLTPEQKGNTAAMQGAVYMMRGALSWKKWDTVPDVHFY